MTGAAFRVRRALLFMPGDDRRKIEKGAGIGVDGVIMDLEDAVAPGRKDAARDTVASALRQVAFGRTERLVRVNSFDSAFFADDVAATLDSHPDTYVLPKVESGDSVRVVDALLSEAERERGWPLGGIALIAMIETARGLLNLREIVEGSSRLAALALGGEDFASDLGAQRTAEGRELFYARSTLVVHAAAYRLQAIDTVFPRYDDTAGLTADTEASLRLGFSGRFAIHPRQVEPIQSVFNPTEEEIDRARRLLYEVKRNHESGAFVFEGAMVDAPMFRRAESVLARAQAAGMLNSELDNPVAE